MQSTGSRIQKKKLLLLRYKRASREAAIEALAIFFKRVLSANRPSMFSLFSVLGSGLEMAEFKNQRNLGAIGLPTQRDTDPCRVKWASQGIRTAERKRIE